MKNRRLLAMLLVFCMVFSNLAMGASAVEAPADSAANAVQKEEAAATETTVSPDTDDVAPGEDAAVNRGLKTLRDEGVVVKSEIVEGTETKTAEGDWNFAPAEAPKTSLLPTEVPECIQELQKAAELFAADETVRAFVVMNEAPLADSYTSKTLASASAEKQMLQKQDNVIAAIERTVLGGKKLDVRYQFTYLTNSFSIETEFVNLEKIAALDGVKSVFIMPVYNAIPTDESTASPYTISAGEMTGVDQVREELGYTGKGMKIAVIDTGLDLDHPSFAAEPETTEDSLTIADIDAVLEDLNAYAKRSTITGKTLYRSAKVPYAFNYVDNNLTADHSADSQGDHGTHVSGIAAANAVEGSSVVGMAPDAQIIVMKVFGAAGGAYTDDIVAALEDAMTLGCDVVNASLGSDAGFSSSDTEIDLIYQRLASQDIVACISAGNSGTSSYDNMWGTDLNRTANPDNATIGSPGIYTNVMTIASADNATVMTSYFSLADGTQIFYSDPYEYYYGMTDLVDPEYWGYTDPIEYVIIDGLGEEADFYDEEGNSLVEGKIAVIKRGSINFGTKIFNAEYAGAVAAIIWDNVSEDIFNFGMQIYDDYGNYPDIPACLVSLEDGTVMAAAETKTLLVSSELGERENATGGQVSSFSSWGVSPDLGLEPDITGIGGNVYSCYDGGTYGLMSGTSMSSPQVAGVTALVMQRLKELYPNAPDGTIRELAEALLMSTADPIIDSTFGAFEASPRQQGAGLVNAYEATTSNVYLTVGGEKPKAELGDSSTGNYTFSFEIHNIGTEAVTYVLDYSLLTEYAAGAQLSETEVEYFMYGAEFPLSGSVAFSKNTVTVPAGGNANVTVSIALSADDKAYFQECWENGGYVEGYVYLTSADDEGVITSELNLPFLGFYGDWTEAPVFDTAYWYDNSFWGVAPADGLPEGDEFYNVMWTDLLGSSWVLGFNPYSGAYLDEDDNVVYDESHNVVSPNGDGAIDGLDEIYLSLMRNAKSLTFTYTVDGEVMHRETITNNSKTMYRSAYGQVVPWLYSWYGYGLYDFTDENGKALPTGTEVILTIDANVDYGTGGDHSIQIPIYVDTTPGEVVDVISMPQEDGSDYLAVLATDETALASVFLMNPAGTQVYAQAYDATMVDMGDGVLAALFDVDELGTEFLVAVCDYACNEAYYDVSYEAADENLPTMDTSALYGYRVHDDYLMSDHMYGWVSTNKPVSGEYANISVLTDDYLEYAAFTAAEYVDGKVFAVDAVYNFVVLDPGLWNRTTICNLGFSVMDMAFDDVTDTMYLLAKDDYSYSHLYTIDLLTGELTHVVEFDYYNYGPWAITFDAEGTLYAIKIGSANLYTVDIDTGAMTAVLNADGTTFVMTDENGTKMSPTAYSQSITYSEADDTIYWAYFKFSWWGSSSKMVAVNMADLTVTTSDYAAKAYDSNGTLVDYYPATEIVGLMVLEDTEYELPEATELLAIQLDADKLIMSIGDNAKVKASANPWNWELGEVTWTSSDEAVATVEGGKITAVGAGNAVITASVGDLTAQCAVTVVDISGSFNAYNYYSGDGNYGYMIDVNMATMSYSLLSAPDADFMAGDYNGHDGCFYGYTEGGQFWRYDMEKDETVAVGDAIGVLPNDMAYDYSTGYLYAVTMDTNNGYSTLSTVNMNNGQLIEVARMDYNFLLTLACDMEGNLYAMDYNGNVLKLTAADGVLTGEPVIESLGSLSYMQSMCYDHNNDVLIWACPEVSSVYWIDIHSEEPFAISLGDPTGYSFQFVGLYTVPEEIPALDEIAVESVSAEDIMVLTTVTKLPNVTILPLNATCQNIAWTSADESIAKINADGSVTGVSEGVVTISGVLKDAVSGETFEVSYDVTVVAAADEIYGHVLTDFATYGGYCWTRLYPTDPSNPDILSYTDYVIYAEEVYNGKLYAVGYDPNDWYANWQMLVMDPLTQKVENQIDLGEGYPFVYDMTYDYATSTMYCVAGPSDNASDLYVMNMETGELTLLLETAEFFMSLAAGPNGKLYAMENSALLSDDYYSSEYGNANLYTIDPVAKVIEHVGDTGIKCNMTASLAYDYDTNKLYWTPVFRASYWDPLASCFAMVDPETGAAASLGMIGAAGAQVSGLFILSDNMPEEAEPALHSLVVTPAKASLTVGASTEVKAVILPMTLDAEVVWTSSKPGVASVDANGVVTGNSSGKATITATVTYGDVTLSDSCEVGVLPADASFLTYNLTDGGWAEISRNNGSVVTNLTEGEETAVAAFTNMNGTVYGYDVENTFFKMDTASYERVEIGQIDSAALIESMLVKYEYTEDEIAELLPRYAFEVRDMDYDAANDRLLVLGNIYDSQYGELNSGNGIYAVDMSNGSLTELYTFDEHYYVMGMAVDANGVVYFYTTYNDYYATLNLNSGEYRNIIALQSLGYYGSENDDHALYFDQITGKLYHLFTGNGLYYRLFSMDPSNGALTLESKYVGQVAYDSSVWGYVGDKFAGMSYVPDAVIPVTSITLDKSELALNEGETAQLTATIEPENATDKYIVWTSSDETVATVDSNGVVTAVKGGTAVITAAAGGAEASCTVTVACVHEWVDATCTEPKTCTKCGETEGEALGHDWGDATCTDPKTCAVCGETEDAALGHSWVDATCTEPKTCSVCGVTEGEALGHSWVDATCTEPKTCSVCGETEGEALGHSFEEGVCTVCGDTDPKYRAPLSGLLRVAGNDRFETSFAVADQMLYEMAEEKFTSVIVAYSHNFPDALTGSYLASVKRAPILLYHDNVADKVLAYITENLAADGTVYVLGGTAVISNSFDAAVADKGFQVKRLAGDNRLGTNLAILEEAGVAADQEILVCTAFNYADSLSAACTRLPMLLVGDELTAEQKAFLEGHTGKITIIGGEGAVSAAIAEELNADRISGANRYETSTEVAHRYFPNPNAVLMAYANDYPDGLCGGSLAAILDAPMILVSNESYAYADEYTENVNGGYILGGTTRITDEVAREVYDLPADAVIPMA